MSAEIAGFGIAGGVSFDALITFAPFSLQTDLGFYITVKAAGIDLAGIWLDVSLTGPNPWVVDGSAVFKVLGFEHEIDVHETIGRRQTEPALPPADPHQAVIDALELADAWTVLTSPSGSGVTVAAVEPFGDTRLASPDSTISVAQRVVPLGIELDRLDQAPIGTFARFDIEARPKGIPITGTALDWFAPASFFDMTPVQALGAPSFEQLEGGVVLGGGDAEAGDAVESTLEYEQFVRDLELGEDGTELDDTHQPMTDARPAIATSVSRGSADLIYALDGGDEYSLGEVEFAAIDAITGATVGGAASWSGTMSQLSGSDVVVPTWELR